MLDEQKFIDGFEDVMERERERYLNATDETRDNARKGYLECASLAAKIQSNDNSRMIEEGKLQVEIERKDEELALKKRSLDEEIELKYQEIKAERRKNVRECIYNLSKLGLVAGSLWASFRYEANGHIYSGKTSGGLLNGILKKPTDYLK